MKLIGMTILVFCLCQPHIAVGGHRVVRRRPTYNRPYISQQEQLRRDREAQLRQRERDVARSEYERKRERSIISRLESKNALMKRAVRNQRREIVILRGENRKLKTENDRLRLLLKQAGIDLKVKPTTQPTTRPNLE